MINKMLLGAVQTVINGLLYILTHEEDAAIKEASKTMFDALMKKYAKPEGNKK
jgi:hypothetical protein